MNIKLPNPPQQNASKTQWEQWIEALWRFVRPTPIASGDVATQIASATSYQGITALSAPRIYTLPDTDGVPDGSQLIVQDESGSAGAHSVTLAASAGDSLVGTSQINVAYGRVTLVKRGTVWYGVGILAGAATPTGPTGAMIPFGAAAAPTGWINADGSPVSRTTYATLFAVIGTTFNTGGEAGTDFRLPNPARRTVVGSGGAGTGTLGNAIGNLGGAETHTLTTAELASHTHTDSGHTHTDSGHHHQILGTDTAGLAVGAIPMPYPNNQANGVQNTTTTSAVISTDAADIQNAGGGGAHNNVQPSLVMNWIIKT